MDKKDWKKPAKKKAEKHIIICEKCIRSSTNPELTEEMFFYVDKGDHISIACIDCIEKNNLIIYKPYKELRKKRETKKKTDE